MRLIFIYCIASVFLANCAPSKAYVYSSEVADYDNYVMDKDPDAIFQKLEERANEPYILGGEDVYGLGLMTLSLFKRLGDKKTYQALRAATESQRSAVKLFVESEDLGSNFKKTRRLLDSIPIDHNWPALKIEERYQ